jgi:hypothetical protein
MNAAIALGLALLARVEEPTLRVVSARDGKPVADAVVELWTDDGAEPTRVATRLSVVRTGADGSARFAYAPQGVRAHLARITCPGFASRTTSSSDLEDGVKLYPLAPLSGRVVDLEGRPVAGAHVRTRETCPHAVSATETCTDGEGRFALSDCPADEQHAELEVLPTTHIPLGALPIDALRRLQARDGTFDVHVARRAPLRVRILDGAGGPVAGRRVVCNERPISAAWTDEDGYATLPPIHTWDAPLSLVDGVGEKLLQPLSVPRSGTFTLCAAEPSGMEGPGRLTLNLDLPQVAETRPSIVVQAADGSLRDGAPFEKLALGRATLRVGQDFTPWQEQVLDVEIVTGNIAIAVTPVAAPAVRVLLPEPPANDCWTSLLIQAGTTGFHKELECALDVRVHVPADESIVVLATSACGEVRRTTHAALQSGVTAIDLRTPATLVRQGVPAPNAKDD